MLYGGLFIRPESKSLDALKGALRELERIATDRDKDHKDIQMWKEVHGGASRLVELWIASYIAFIRELKEVEKEEDKVNWTRAQINGGQSWITAYFRCHMYLATSKQGVVVAFSSWI